MSVPLFLLMPPHLFKFQAYSAFALESLLTGWVWYSAPERLNDPYDGQLKIHSDVADAYEAGCLAVQMVEMVTGWKGGRLPYDHKAADWRAGFDRFVAEWTEDVCRRGIYSMSEVGNHLLLWAHYADSHRGLAVRYGIAEQQLDGVSLAPVNYVAEPPRLHLRDLIENFPAALRTRYTTKGQIWEYEKEWRAISSEGDCLLPAPGMVDQIIFGHRLPAHSRQAIRNAVDANIEFCEAIPSDVGFEVEIRRV